MNKVKTTKAGYYNPVTPGVKWDFHREPRKAEQSPGTLKTLDLFYTPPIRYQLVSGRGSTFSFLGEGFLRAISD